MDKFFRAIENLQAKPVYVRKRVLYVATTTIFVLIFGLWLKLLPMELRNAGRQTANVGSSTPFSTISRSFDEVRKSVGELKAAILPDIEYVRKETSDTMERIEEAKKQVEAATTTGTIVDASTTPQEN